MRIAVMGAGSMGSIIGAYISRAGGDVVLVDVNRDHVDAMNEKGLRIIGKDEATIPVRALFPEDMEGIYDFVIYLPKAVYNEQALTSLLPHIGPDSSVITLQNGINEDAVAAKIGQERTLGGIINWGGILREPGVSELATEKEQMSFEIGEIDGRVTERLESLKAVLSHVCRTDITDKLMSVRWAKLFVNAAFSGVGTVIDGDYGAVLDDDKAVQAAWMTGVETLITAMKLGHAETPVLMMNPELILYRNKEELEGKIKLVRIGLRGHRNVLPSMLQDIRKGLPCEIEVINGYVQKKSREAGIETPVNDQVTEIIRELGKGSRRLGSHNLDDINLPDIP